MKDMIRKIFFAVIITAISVTQVQAEVKYLRATWNNDPATSMVIGWSGNDGTLYYGTVDKGTDYTQYPSSKVVTRHVSYTKSGNTLENYFVELTGLSPKTVYYFVIRENGGNLSSRYSIMTMSENNEDRISFVSCGDTRDAITAGENCAGTNCRTLRQSAFTLLAKTRPDFIAFSGDFVGGPYQDLFKNRIQQWSEWFTDWQLSIYDGRIIPLIPARGNHEEQGDIYDQFDFGSSLNYFYLKFGGDLLKIYSLNSELGSNATQTSWLQSNLAIDTTNGAKVYWKTVNYHKPMVAQGNQYGAEPSIINNWAPLFPIFGVRLAMEGHTHIYKVSWPSIKYGGQSNNYFKRDDATGCVFIGEGNMGAPFRTLDPKYTWTRETGQKFASFFYVEVNKDSIYIQTARVENVEAVTQQTDNIQGSDLPSGVTLHTTATGAVNGDFETIYPFGRTSPITTGIQNFEKIEYAKIFPNPANDLINIQFNANFKGGKVQVFDALGHQCKSQKINSGQNMTTLDVSDLCSGVNYVYITSENGIQTQKIIKQ